MKFSLDHEGNLILDNDNYKTWIARAWVRDVLSVLDAGHGDTLRHYAEHGTLPVEAPVWPGLRVCEALHGSWDVYDAENVRRATVAPHERGYRCTLQSGGAPYATTPQAAVDAARAWLAERWGLST